MTRALALGLAAACTACEPAVHELRQAPSGGAGTLALVDALSARFGETEREPGFDALRPKLARAVLVPSWAFDDRSAWPPGQGADWRAVEFAGYRSGSVYRIGVRTEAPEPIVPGQYRGALGLERLGSGRYEWSVREELAAGPLRPADLSAALDGLFRGLEHADEAKARSAALSAFPRASARLGQLLGLETLGLAKDAQGAMSLRLALRVTPDGLRAEAPHYASFLQKYLTPIRAHVVVTDAAGATWWTLEGQRNLWTLRLRLRGGSLVPLEGDAERRLPASLRATIDYSTRMGRFAIGASGLVADVALTRTPVEKSFVAHFRQEPHWDLPFLVETLLGGPLSYPFEAPGSEAGWGAREMPSGTQLFRHYRARMRETFVLRWLGGMTSRALAEFRADAEPEAERYDAQCLRAVRDDLAALVPAPHAAPR